MGVRIYLGCGLLVIIYVNLFPVWKVFRHVFGGSFMAIVPVVAAMVLLGGCILFLTFRKNPPLLPVRWSFVLLGVFLSVSALFIPEPEISAKRIHVFEYVLLSFFVRYGLAQKMRGDLLLFFSIIFTGILGIHDELLQGFHPLRTYGLRDMLVNGVAGAGGGLIWHGFNLFSPVALQSHDVWQKTTLQMMYLSWLLLATLALIVPLFYYRAFLVPLWPCLPLCAAIFFYICLPRSDATSWSHGIRVISVGAFLFLLYPLVINGAKMLFY